ncbi:MULTISPECIES: RNA polymerase sigma factor [Bacteroides]|uniref:RNA polymerase sigma factor n=1 Tax=Bacteroides TaxID=816 RepID=UPI001C3777F7|nr:MULTISPECIES: sigma-70 family RNA polymerase sigma factor [Bacteroides]MBV3635971.1 sigma-70 family RNA polymerase sigma factor [Bacteroides cellulosilyticus]MBV3662291.1 sigma-70 family RNA polymerase sigma factor [Bacteroides cellulosilyticus]MBV3684412.1 sigma-70 family RNA polymerase sigma factor [Bacteroides cellulosilyticus]MBV3692973.1 sigma-70 family RNA polymerase sigma factor [Bacteroides cellulosilyticus]MBV3706460.1 sigma-70 family RNA polymerase sigma factor [Bacteroides cellul
MMEQTNNSTETLLASFQAGNMAAFSELYDLHINILFNYGLKLTIDKELLKDCIHDIFVKLYVKKDELGVIDNLKSYLFISLKNKLCDELRKRMYMSDTAVEEINVVSSTDVEDDYMEEEKTRNNLLLVNNLMDQLSPRQREALTLYYIEEKKYEDICEIMDMNYQSVRNLMHRGLTKLRALVG